MNETSTIAVWLEYDATFPYNQQYPRYAFWDEGDDSWTTGTIELNGATADIAVAMDEESIIATWIEYNSAGDKQYPRYAFYSPSTDSWTTGTIELYPAFATEISVATHEQSTIATWLNYKSSGPYDTCYPLFAIYEPSSDSWTTGTIEYSPVDPYSGIAVTLNQDSTIAAWVSYSSLEDQSYPLYANLNSRSDSDSIQTISVSREKGHFKFESFGWFTFLIRIPFPHQTHSVYYNNKKLETLHHHNDLHYVIDPNPDIDKTLIIKDDNLNIIAYLNVPKWER